MPNSFKLYQKNNDSGEKYFFGKVFFRKPMALLMALSNFKPPHKSRPSVQDISRLISLSGTITKVFSDTDVCYSMGVFSFSSSPLYTPTFFGLYRYAG